MEEFGGLYADLDVELLRDVEPELPAAQAAAARSSHLRHEVHLGAHQVVLESGQLLLQRLDGRAGSGTAQRPVVDPRQHLPCARKQRQRR